MKNYRAGSQLVFTFNNRFINTRLLCTVHNFPPPSELLFCCQPHRQKSRSRSNVYVWNVIDKISKICFSTWTAWSSKATKKVGGAVLCEGGGGCARLYRPSSNTQRVITFMQIYQHICLARTHTPHQLRVFDMCLSSGKYWSIACLHNTLNTTGY